MFVRPSDRRSPIDQGGWVAGIPQELLIHIFSLLDPYSLSMCRGASLFWREVASEGNFYLNFAQKLKFFSRSEGAQYFITDSREKFLKHYTSVKAIGYEVAVDLCAHPESLKKTWNTLLPSRDSFIGPFFSKLDYLTIKGRAIAYMEFGALQYEDKEINRPLFLGAYFGDQEMVKKVWSKIEGSSVDKQFLLFSAAAVAVIGKNNEALSFLKDLGMDFDAPTFAGLTFAQYILSQGWSPGNYSGLGE